jgi:predicted peptidase/lysophospholipase L1-like esterase
MQGKIIWMAAFLAFGLAAKPKPDKTTVYIVGDSLAANKDWHKYPLAGWGQILSHFFDQQVTIKNKAVDGATTHSFFKEGHWKPVIDSVQNGDYVLIEFGHNDEKVDLPGIGVQLPEYRANLLQIIKEVRAKAGIPVLLTPVSRRSFENGKFQDTHRAYADAIRGIGTENHVSIIDLEQKTEQLLRGLGDEGSKKMYNWVDSAAMYASYPKGVSDNTHLSITGAYQVAAYIARGIEANRLPVSKHIRNIEQVRKLAPASPAFHSDPLHPDYSADTLTIAERKFSDFQFKEFENNEHILPYRLHEPSAIEKGKKYPLVLFLHGAGERGWDNRRQLMRYTTVSFWKDHACYVLAPQCPDRPPFGPDGDDVWVQTNFGAQSSHMRDKPSWPLAMVMQLVDEFIKKNRDHIDTDRIYITGLSMGGFATWEILQREGNKFAAAVPVCGGADLDYASKLTEIPIWVFHGDADNTVPVKRSRDIVAAITAAGGHPKYSELPGVGHGAWVNAYNDPKTWDWLFMQKK